MNLHRRLQIHLDYDVHVDDHADVLHHRPARPRPGLHHQDDPRRGAGRRQAEEEEERGRRRDQAGRLRRRRRGRL